MFKDVFVCGSSHASGVGKGKVSSDDPGTKSWVRFFAEKTNADNVWNISLPGKPLGLANADVIKFCREYWDRYRTYDNLIVLIEYTIPQYRTFDPVAMARDDTRSIEVIPVNYYKMLRDNQHLVDPQLKLESKTEGRYIEQKFYQRTDMKFLDHYEDKHDSIYKEIDVSELDEVSLALHNAKVKEWFEFDTVNPLGHRMLSDEKLKKYVKYAIDELYFAKRWLEDHNIPYMMFWVGGQSERFCTLVDRSFREMIQTNRLIPMKQFTSVKASQQWSKKHWRSHPDAQGSERISEFLLEWILANDLYKKPKDGVLEALHHG